MPAFSHDGSSFHEELLRVWNGSSWTDENDNVWAWDGASWVLIQPRPSAGALLPVVDLAVIEGPTDHSVTVGWSLPAQPTVTPTEVHVRVAEISGIWLTYDYPMTQWAHDSLFAETAYQCEVKLVRRIDAVITHESDPRSVFFTTGVPAGPGTPAPDPGGGPGDTIIPVPIYPGVDCTTGWKLESMFESDWILVDSGTSDTGEVPFAEGELTAGIMYRICTREECTPGTPGPWVCGDPFFVPEDWGDPCTAPWIMSKAPFTDCKVFVAEICAPDLLTEAVLQQPITKGPCFMFLSYGAAHGGISLSSTDEGVVGYGNSANLAPALFHQSMSILTRVMFNEVPTRSLAVWRCGPFEIQAVPEGPVTPGRFRIRASLATAAAGVITSLTSGLLDDDTEYVFAATYNHLTGELITYVDGVVAQSAIHAGAGITIDGPDTFEMRLPAISWGGEAAAWNRVLTAGEISAATRVSNVVPPTHIVGQYILPLDTNTVGGPGDPFLSGFMMNGRTLLTVSASNPELWSIDLDSPGISGVGLANVTRTVIAANVVAGKIATGVATGGHMWASISSPYRVAKIHPTTAAVVGTVAVGNPYHILGTDSWIYNSDAPDFVQRIDPAGPTIVATSPNLAGGAGLLCLDQENNILWSIGGSSKLVGLNPSTLAVVKGPITLPTGGQNHQVSVDGAGTYLYAVDSSNGAIYRITIATMAVTTFPGVISINTNHEETPSVVIGDQLYCWHRWVENSSQDMLAKVDLGAMTATYMTGMLDIHFAGYGATHFDDDDVLWIMGRNTTAGNGLDSLMALSTGPVRGPKYGLGTWTGDGGGGNVSQQLSYYDGQIVHTFTRASSTAGGFSMTLTTLGSDPPDHVDFLIVGGGGGGGSANMGNTSCGGGGGGEVAEYLNQPAFMGNTTIVVGSGGAGAGGASESNGQDTTVKRSGSATPDYSAWGGGGGGHFADGGLFGHWASGAGACGIGFSQASPGRGNDGRGGGGGAGASGAGGGGGGAGGPGFPTPPGTSPRSGGPGKASSILTGSPIYYGGGGGGGGILGSGGHAGGIGGGGGTSTDAAANSGGGGGGAEENFPIMYGKYGGYGAFILRYPAIP